MVTDRVDVGYDLQKNKSSEQQPTKHGSDIMDYADTFMTITYQSLAALDLVVGLFFSKQHTMVRVCNASLTLSAVKYVGLVYPLYLTAEENTVQ